MAVYMGNGEEDCVGDQQGRVPVMWSQSCPLDSVSGRGRKGGSGMRDTEGAGSGRGKPGRSSWARASEPPGTQHPLTPGPPHPFLPAPVWAAGTRPSGIPSTSLRSRDYCSHLTNETETDLPKVTESQNQGVGEWGLRSGPFTPGSRAPGGGGRAAGGPPC